MLDRGRENRFTRARKKGRHLRRANLKRKSKSGRKRTAESVGPPDGERSDVATGADIGIPDALFSGINADAFRRPVAEQIAVMLLPRDAQNAEVNARELLQVGGCFIEGYGAELRPFQTAPQEFTRNTEIIDGTARKKAVPDVEPLRHRVEREGDQRPVGSAGVLRVFESPFEQLIADAAALVIGRHE